MKNLKYHLRLITMKEIHYTLGDMGIGFCALGIVTYLPLYIFFIANTHYVFKCIQIFYFSLHESTVVIQISIITSETFVPMLTLVSNDTCQTNLLLNALW